MNVARTRAILLSVLLLSACGEDDTSVGSTEDLFSASVTEVVVEIDYQRGAAPYVDSNRGDPFRLFNTNIEALFSANPRTITIDDELAEMQELTDITGRSFSTDDILDIADRHRDESDTETRRTFYVVFLDGYFFSGGERQTGVLGVSIGNTGVVAMFKPVINSTAVERFVEQTTLIHEFGHAVGLVNNRLPLTVDHQDEEHGAHCTNRDCVMYWLNESVLDLVEFVNRVVTDNDVVIFGPDCLADTVAASQ